MSLLSDVADWMQIAGVPLALGALGVGLWQVIKAARTARVQVLLALDESLSNYEDVRRELNKPQPDFKADEMEVRLRRYIAAFERVGHALKLKEIKIKTVDQFYGSRFVKLIKYSGTLSIADTREGWNDFYHLWDRLRDYKGNKRGLAKPPINEPAGTSIESRASSKIVFATWGLVAATVGLVIATVVLVIVAE